MGRVFPGVNEFFPVGGLGDLVSRGDTDFEPIYSSVQETVLAPYGPIKLACGSTTVRGHAVSAAIAIATAATPQKLAVFVPSDTIGFSLFYFSRLELMLSRSRSRRDAKTIIPTTNGGMQGTATAETLT